MRWRAARWDRGTDLVDRVSHRLQLRTCSGTPNNQVVISSLGRSEQTRRGSLQILNPHAGQVPPRADADPPASASRPRVATGRIRTPEGQPGAAAHAGTCARAELQAARWQPGRAAEPGSKNRRLGAPSRLAHEHVSSRFASSSPVLLMRSCPVPYQATTLRADVYAVARAPGPARGEEPEAVAAEPPAAQRQRPAVLSGVRACTGRHSRGCGAGAPGDARGPGM